MCPHLTCLNICFSAITDVGFSKIASNCNRLEKVDITQTLGRHTEDEAKKLRLITASSIIELLEKCSNMKLLILDKVLSNELKCSIQYDKFKNTVQLVGSNYLDSETEKFF